MKKGIARDGRRLQLLRKLSARRIDRQELIVMHMRGAGVSYAIARDDIKEAELLGLAENRFGFLWITKDGIAALRGITTPGHLKQATLDGKERGT